MKKNFYLIEAWILSHIAFFMFGRYFHSPALYFDEILERLSMHLSEFIEGEAVILVVMAVFLLAKKKYSDILENDITKRCVYIFIFIDMFLKNYSLLSLN